MNGKCAKTTNRMLWLDIAKLFGILIVLMVHTDVTIPYVSMYLGSFMIPVFFVLSGYTWKYREESFWQFALQKGKRLLIPYFVCNLLLAAFYMVRVRAFDKLAFLGIFYSRYMLMQPDSSWNCGLMNMMNSPTWFLTCLFVTLCIYFLIDYLCREKKMRRFAVAAGMLLGICLAKFSPVLMPWSLENALLFLGLLEFGRFLREEGMAWLKNNQWIYGNVLLIFLVLGYINGSINISIDLYGKSILLCLIVGALGSLLCMKGAQLCEQYLGGVAKVLSFAGRYTIHILCWHLFVIEVLKALLGI